MSASPIYGERPQLQGSFRRSFTTPTRQLSFHEKAGLEKADAGAEILYSHSSVRVVSFSPPKESIKSTSKAEIPADTDYPVDTVETLPWRSRTETLAASGVMVLEKVRGSTNFLKCQSITHAILRNSQCWCVDGESKFVLRVRKFQYYRIELPSTTEEDKAKVEELKKVFPTVLKYERTPCPFIRAFTVDLPDDAITPRRKGQWKRRDSSQPNTPDTETPPPRRSGQTRSWSMRNPPTSYPKHGPGSSFENFEGERGRTNSPSSVSRRASFFENQRNDSPGSFVQSDEGTDSEHQLSEHGDELEDTPDRSETDSPQAQLHGGSSKPLLSDLVIDKPSLRGSSDSPDQQEGLETTAVPSNKHQEFRTNEQAFLSNSVGPQASLKHETGKQNTEELTIQQEALQVSGEHEDMTIDPAQHVTRLAEGDVASSAMSKEHEIEVIQKHWPHIDMTAAGTAAASVISSAGPPTECATLYESDESLHEKTAKSSEPSKVSLMDAATDENDTDNPTSSKDRWTADVSQQSSNLDEAHSTPMHMSRAMHRDSDQEDPSEPTESLSSTTSTSATESSGEEQEEEDDESTSDVQSTEGSSESEEAESSVEQDFEARERRVTREGSSEHSDEDEHQDEEDEMSPTSSVDSFHTLASPFIGSSINNIFDMSHSSSSGRIEQRPAGSIRHKRDISEITVTASNISDTAAAKHDILSRERPDDLQASLLSQNASGVSHIESIPSSSATPDQEGLRQRHKGQRSFSPLPPASTIFTGNKIHHSTGSGHMTKVILQKLIIKPLEVAVMVVHILTRIAAGATVSDLLSGELFRQPESHQTLSGFTDQRNHGKNHSDNEDDYGVPIRGRQRSTERSVPTSTTNDNRAISTDVD